MAAATPEETTVVGFNGCINARDLEGLTRLMSDDHRFVDAGGHVVVAALLGGDATR